MLIKPTARAARSTVVANIHCRSPNVAASCCCLNA